MASRVHKKKRVRDPGQTRLKLLQATVDLIAEKGQDALSLKEAASRAKLSRGVAYQHFRDRAHLLSEAKRWISDQLADGVQNMAAAPMEERTRFGARLVLNNRRAAKLMIADALAGKSLTSDHPLYKLTKKMLRSFVASGDARKGLDLEVLTYIMLGTSAVMLMLGETHKRVPSNDLADRFAAEWSHILARGIFRNPN
jgi:AcrR family transcriptional regulator